MAGPGGVTGADRAVVVATASAVPPTTLHQAPPRHPVVGLSVALVSAAAFATSGAFAKSLLVAGWAPGSVVTLRITLAALVLLVPTLLALRGRWAAMRRNAWVVVGYGLTGVAGCQLAYFYAVTHLSVGVALLLEYLAPVLIVLWLWGRHRQVPRRLTVLGVGLAVIGLLLVLDVVGAGATVSLVGVLWGLGAAVCLVLYFLLAAHVDDDVPALGLAGGGLAVGAIALWAAGLSGLLDTTRGAAEVVLSGIVVPWWVPILVIALVAAAFAYVTGIVAVRLLGPKVASFVALTEVLFAVLFAWIVLAELPAPIQLVGGLLIVGGVVAVRADESRRSPGADEAGVREAASPHTAAPGGDARRAPTS
ncbi:EamA family transporter [Humibacillus xanthopallidus]|uniref:Threonine/homoserine efflux transporter RhtA n=1 Tax=Humibacillus xanthopallidus TaxID=412689 RepID=A0A543I0Q7_9MICO|nr:DMT family transporter [Humibacillus xanthopallidus]TQM64176.1 threonine/homoserine efflux transporter RhtA [Humibacillus xanthopallidus]